ncbi:MAG: hypothetical protein ACPG5U_11045 [Planktomarina sp.]
MKNTRKTYKILCEFSFVSGKGVMLDQLQVLSDTHRCTLEFTWSWAAPDALRADVVSFLTSLMERCFPTASTGGLTVETTNFLAQMPGLRFENLVADRGTDGTGTMSLHMTQGDLTTLLGTVEDRNISDPLDDVFLPLTNLSSYLQAMKDQTGDQGCSRAVGMTADRIDEFLLIYGGRLQNSVRGTGRSNLQ